ncbi:MAG: hypothetical protein ACI8XV_001205 [Arenicella sp.]|jgi:hypothetical protein
MRIIRIYPLNVIDNHSHLEYLLFPKLSNCLAIFFPDLVDQQSLKYKVLKK